MKIAQINAVYGKGSTGKTTSEMHEFLKNKGHESYVFWATGAKGCENDKNVIRIGTTLDHKLHAALSRLFHNQAFNSRFATRSLIKKLKKIEPDVVHLGNLHSNYINFKSLLKYLAKYKIPTVLTLHDCWFLTGGCFHYKLDNCEGYKYACENCPQCKTKYEKKKRQRLFAKKKALFSRLSKLAVVGVSEWTDESARESNMFCENAIHTYVHNWIDLETFKPTCDREVLKKFGIPEDKKIILGVAQSWRADKGRETFEKISELIEDDALVVLVGNANGAESTNKLKYIGRTESPKELAALYTSAAVFVNPSPAETFGKVTAEALACGAPVVAYNNTGTAELVKDFSGILTEDGNESALIENVLKILNTTDENKEKRIDFAKKSFNLTKQIEKYVALYENLR